MFGEAFVLSQGPGYPELTRFCLVDGAVGGASVGITQAIDTS
jgi:hypothetical protein